MDHTQLRDQHEFLCIYVSQVLYNLHEMLNSQFLNFVFNDAGYNYYWIGINLYKGLNETMMIL